MQRKEGTIYLLVFLALLAVSFLVVKPFINALLTGAVMAYAFYPLYRRIQAKLKYKVPSAVIVSLLIIVIVTVPAFLLLQNSAEDAKYLYLIIKQRVVTGNILGFECYDLSKPLCKVVSSIRKLTTDPEFSIYIQDFLGKLASSALDNITQTLLSLPRIILNLAVSFFVMFYLLIDGKEFAQRTKLLMPVSSKHQEHIFRKIQDVVHSVLFGSIVVAVIQGAMGAVGFWAVGLPSPLFWGVIMAVFALVPFVGTAIVWVPASLLLLANGAAENNQTIIWKAVALFIYSFIFVAGIDNVLKPRMIGKRAGVHPVLVFVGALGGIALFGAIGFVIGPLMLALLDTFIKIYESERTHL